MMFEVMEHLPHPVQFLRRAEVVVRPGGLIYLTTPNFNSLDRRVLGAEWNVFHREHLTYFTPATIIEAIRRNTKLELLHAETRNLSSELISHFRNTVWLASSRNNGHISAENNRHSIPSDLRTKIENSQVLSLLKRGANSLLNATSLGSTIVLLLRRPE